MSPFDDPIDGFVRMNGRTLGSASSGATEYAGADGHDLFVKLYSKYSDTRAPVSGAVGQAQKTIGRRTRRSPFRLRVARFSSVLTRWATAPPTCPGINDNLGHKRFNRIHCRQRDRPCARNVPHYRGGGGGDYFGYQRTAVTLSTPVYPGTTNASASLGHHSLDDAQAVGGAGSQTVTRPKVGVHKTTITDPGSTTARRIRGEVGNVPQLGFADRPNIRRRPASPLTTPTAPNPTQNMQPGMIGLSIAVSA